jgi:hypothetical protein
MQKEFLALPLEAKPVSPGAVEAGTVLLRFEEPDLAGFLGETEDLVPRGQESTWLPA